MSQLSKVEPLSVTVSPPQEIEQAVQVLFPPHIPEKWEALDKLEAYMHTLPHFYGEVTERGTPGLYSREIIMPTGSVFTSRIHKVEHQFIVSEGSVVVYNTLDDTTLQYKAGDHGHTRVGTRRVLYIIERCKWTTFHPTDKIKEGFELLTEEEKKSIFNEIFCEIIQEYSNPFMEDLNKGVFV